MNHATAIDLLHEGHRPPEYVVEWLDRFCDPCRSPDDPLPKDDQVWKPIHELHQARGNTDYPNADWIYTDFNEAVRAAITVRTTPGPVAQWAKGSGPIQDDTNYRVRDTTTGEVRWYSPFP